MTKEIENSPEQLTEEFAQFLRRYLKAGEPGAFRVWMLKAIRAIEVKDNNPMSDLPIEMVDSLPDDKLREVFEHIGPDYGIFTSIPDERLIFGHLLPTAKDVRTLSIGSGVAPHEIFLASKGIINHQIVATDYTQALVARGRKIARQAKVTNVRFARLNATDLSFREEFGQVWMIDSLHWMIGWKTAVKKAAGALEEGGNMFICYSRFSPRIKIGENDLIAQLTEQGMDVTKVAFQDSPSHSPRVIVTATKTKSKLQTIIIPTGPAIV